MTTRLDYRVDDESMGGMLRWNAQHRGEHPAIVCGERSLSYEALNARANQLANALSARGVSEGNRVAVFLPNCVEFVEIYCAAAKTGFVVTPINYMLTPNEIRYVLDDSGATALIYATEKQDLIDASGAAEAGVIRRELLLAVGSPDGYEGALRGTDASEPMGSSHPDGLFYLGYTSGTTGAPKGCLQLHSAFVNLFKRALLLYNTNSSQTMLIPGPLFHEAPVLLTLAQLFYGGTVVALPRFSPDGALNAIESHRCTIIGFAVPAMLDPINSLDAPHDVSSLSAIICGGAPLLDRTIEATLGRFPKTTLHEFYGATELGLMTSIVHTHSSKRRTAGTPAPGVNVVILDDQDRPLPPGKVGQIFVSPIMMEGYHNRPEQTAEDTREFGGVRWFTLGDLGFLDSDGSLFLVDRKKHMIVSGGENVYPIEVEAVLSEHPAIREISVIGLPDARWGEAVTAVIVPVAEPPSIQELRSFAADRLAAYKIPKRVIAVRDLPRSASGKVLKHVLRAKHEKQGYQDEECF